MGEKTTEVALRTAAEDTAKQLGFEMTDFTVYPDVNNVPPRYIYFMEIEKMPEGMKAKEIRFALEKNLAQKPIILWATRCQRASVHRQS